MLKNFMTTTPKASRFRLGLNRAQKPSTAPAKPKPEPQPPAEPAAAEGYSARQLRIVRRVSEKNGIKFSIECHNLCSTISIF